MKKKKVKIFKCPKCKTDLKYSKREKKYFCNSMNCLETKFYTEEELTKKKKPWYKHLPPWWILLIFFAMAGTQSYFIESNRTKMTKDTTMEYWEGMFVSGYKAGYMRAINDVTEAGKLTGEEYEIVWKTFEKGIVEEKAKTKWKEVFGKVKEKKNEKEKEEEKKKGWNSSKDIH